MDIEDIERKPTSLRGYLNSAKESIAVLSWIWKNLQTPEQKKYFRKMFVFMIINIGAQSLLPLALAYIANGLLTKSDNMLVLGCVAIVVVEVVQKFVHLMQARCREWILGSLQASLDDFITKMIFEKSLGQHSEHSSSLNSGNIDKGRWKLLDLQGLLLFEGFSVLTTLAISYTMLLVFWTRYAAILTPSFVIYVVWTMFLNHRVATECDPLDKKFRRLNRRRLERWDKIERVKTSAKTDEEFQEMSDEFQSVLTEDRKFWFWFIGQNSRRDITITMARVVSLLYAAWQIRHGDLDLGNLFPIFTWTSTVVSNVWQIGRIEHQINWNMPAVKATIDAVSTPPDFKVPDNPIMIGKEPISIEFRDISYVYPEKSPKENDDPAPDEEDDVVHALKGISFILNDGDKVGILGRSGAGKSTLAKLILRSMDPTRGSILVNGHDLRDIDQRSWLQAIGYIPQHPQILDGTILYNLTYAMPKAEAESLSEDEIWALMRDLQIDFGKRLNNGLQTEVGRNGIKLSGGQSQRLIIGAAAIKRPRVMLIDEATSSLDSTTERKVQQGLEKVLTKDVTAIVIAHRLSTVRKTCNKFVVLKTTDELRNGDSQIEAVAGSFEELMEVSPTFRLLAQDQGLSLS